MVHSNKWCEQHIYDVIHDVHEWKHTEHIFAIDNLLDNLATRIEPDESGIFIRFVGEEGNNAGSVQVDVLSTTSCNIGNRIVQTVHNRTSAVEQCRLDRHDPSSLVEGDCDCL